jgi:hypothetical protein
MCIDYPLNMGRKSREKRERRAKIDVEFDKYVPPLKPETKSETKQEEPNLINTQEPNLINTQESNLINTQEVNLTLKDVPIVTNKAEPTFSLSWRFKIAGQKKNIYSKGTYDIETAMNLCQSYTNMIIKKMKLPRDIIITSGPRNNNFPFEPTDIDFDKLFPNEKKIIKCSSCEDNLDDFEFKQYGSSCSLCMDAGYVFKHVSNTNSASNIINNMNDDIDYKKKLYTRYQQLYGKHL